jgi:periplasmic divalent cation tolerance protein
MTGMPPPAAGDPAGTPAALVVLIAIPSALAEAVARRLVEEGRAACVNCVPRMRSIYTWAGHVEEAEESLLLVKTTAAGYPALERRVRELHPYEVPELLALPAVAGFGPYLEWLNRSVTAA